MNTHKQIIVILSLIFCFKTSSSNFLSAGAALGKLANVCFSDDFGLPIDDPKGFFSKFQSISPLFILSR